MLISTLGLIVASAVLLWAYFRMKTHRLLEMAEKIPGPKALPIIGNALEFGTTPKGLLLNITRLAHQYGAIFRFWLLSDLYIALQDPDYVQAVLSDSKILDKSSSYDVLKPWLGSGLITGTGEVWKASRKLVTPAFHFKILEQFVEVFNSNANILVETLADHVSGSEFNICPYISLCALDSICETSMGVRVEAQRNSHSDYVQAITSMCDILVARVFNPLYHLDVLFHLSSVGRLHDRNLLTLHAMTSKVIKERREQILQATAAATPEDCDAVGRRKHVPFLELLIQSQDGAMSDDGVRQEVDTIMFAGYDTTSSALSFICWVLASHQHAQEKLVEELRQIFGDSERSPTLHDLQKMNYLERVIKETLRLYPVVPIFGRKISEDISLGTYTLPAGANIFIIPYNIHRNPEYFPDPEKFDPDRFSSENILNRHPYCYIPFAAGSRNCLGQKYAMLLLKSSVSILLRRYKLLPGTTPIDLATEVVLKSLSGINIKLEMR